MNLFCQIMFGLSYDLTGGGPFRGETEKAPFPCASEQKASDLISLRGHYRDGSSTGGVLCKGLLYVTNALSLSLHARQSREKKSQATR